MLCEVSREMQPAEEVERRASSYAVRVPPASGLQWSVLGPLDVRRGDTVVAISGARRRALLVRLLLSRNEVVPADLLIDDLWGDDPPRHPINALQAYLSYLRNALGAGRASEKAGSVIETHKPGYVVRIGDDELDTVIFDRLAVQGHTALAAQRVDEAARTLPRALALWRGPALVEFADLTFARPEASRLEERRRVVVEDLFDAELALGRHDMVIASVESEVAAHPLRERLWGQLMLALYRAGRQAEALRVYQDVRRTLGEELGIEPSPALQLLEEQILLQKPELAWHREPAAERVETRASQTRSLLPVELAGPHRHGFVGRAGQLRELRAHWDHARAGQMVFVVLSGEPGIGKTRLATEFARRVHAEGTNVLFGRSDERPLMAYQPVAEAVGWHLSQRTPSEVDALLGEEGPDIARLVPNLGGRHDEIAPAPTTDPESARYRLFSAVRTLLGRLATSGPLVLVLDDLQWADEPTLLLLRHLARRSDLPLLVIATYRDTDVDDDHPVALTLADLRREEWCFHLRLLGLEEPEVRSLLGQAAGEDAPAGPARALRERTQGNPFFLGELIGHREHAGAFSMIEDGGSGVPDGVKTVVARRVSRLSEEAIRIVTVAAVMGSQFDITPLERVLELSPDAVLESLEEATRRGLLVEVPSTYGVYRFSHALIRDVVYARLSATRRVRMHQRIGKCLEAISRGDAGHDVAQLAYHFTLAAAVGESDKAVRYSAEAAKLALRGLAYEEAERYYRSALESLELAPRRDDARRADLLLALADAEDRRGDVDAALDSVLAAAEVARRTESPELLCRAALTLARCRTTRPGESMKSNLLEEALQWLPASDSSMRVQVLAALAQHRAARADDDGSYGVEAVAMARRLGDEKVLMTALQARLAALGSPEHWEARLATSVELTELSHRLGEHDRAFIGEVHRFWARFESAGLPRPAR